MAKVYLEIAGVDGPVVADQRFSTVVRYVDKGQASGERITLRTGNGRVAFLSSQVTLISEVLEAGETAEAEDKAEEPAEETPVAAAEEEGGKSPFSK